MINDQLLNGGEPVGAVARQELEEEEEEPELSDSDQDDDTLDSSEAGGFRSEEHLIKVLSQHDPERMILTRKENRQALDIKEMVEGLADLDNLSDLMYAQLAIICGNNVEDAVQRCYGMQEFRHEYNIVDNFEQGRRYLRWVFKMFPWQFLSFPFSEKDGAYVFVHDFSKFEPKAFTCPDMADDWLKSMYYSHFLFIPDLESIRKGLICVIECEEMKYRRDVNKHFSFFFSQFLTHYPFYGQCHWYHTGAMVNIFASILRKILPKDLRDNFLVGYQFDGNLGDAWLVPTVEEANARMLASMETALQLRYQNEKNFVLRDWP